MATSPTDQTVLYEIKFSQLFELLVQQEDERLPQVCVQRDFRGAKGGQVIKQIGTIEPDERVMRLEPISFSDVPHDARWAYPINFDKAVPFDSFDEIQTSADPRSEYVKAMMAGMNRARDREVLRACFETSKTGEQGGSTTAFPAAQIVASNFGASADTGFTVAKLRQARLQLRQAEVDLTKGGLYACLGGTQEDNLLAEAQVVSTDFNDKPVLVEGKIERFLGVQFIHTEQVAMDSTATYALNPVFAGDAIAFGTWMATEVDISVRRDLRGKPWQVYINAAFGATRLQEKKVIQVKSTGH